MNWNFLLVGCAAVVSAFWGGPKSDIHPISATPQEIAQVLSGQGIQRSTSDVEKIRALFEHALGAQLQLMDRGQSGGSAVGQDAVEIASALDLDARASSPAVARAVKALAQARRGQVPPPEQRPSVEWVDYFRKIANLASDPTAERLFSSYGFSPVKISWEDIGRDEGSVWGSRISDVGIWGRLRKGDLQSADLMLTVRRDANFRDKVLMVPAENIKLHRRAEGTQLEEVTLPQRLKELGLLSPSGRFDKNVVVSNQFSIVPVPDKAQTGVDALAFNFSVFPYGSTNYVIADTIEGSSEVVVGGPAHQLIYFNDHGKKAPFTAARASQRQDVVAAAEEMRKAGLDVDVQRFYLIQIPLKHEARGIEMGSMGSPPFHRFWPMAMAPSVAAGASITPPTAEKAARRSLEDVVVGHGDTEGDYRVGNGFSGNRSDERVRVTVCYFVTPKGELTPTDMEAFASKFKSWDQKAIWGGSFVVPEPEGVAAK